jgi:hypothetical protein
LVSLTLRKEHKLRVFGNMVLRRIFGLKREEIKGDRKKLHKEELRNLTLFPNIIRMTKSRRMRMPRQAPRAGEKRNGHRILVGKAEKRDH